MNRMRISRVWLLVAALALSLVGARVSALAELLPTDPTLVTGKLDNGLSYIIKKHGNPAGRLGIWLHVASGSLNESEDTRGIAHYLEHMAFNGSANFPPGSLVPFFQSLGMTFGRDQNAFTSFEQTTYQLALPDTKPETIDKGMLFLSDVAMRLSLLPAEVENEREIILEEERSRAGAQQRVRDYIYERLAPESTFGRRLPIGTTQTVRSITAGDLKEYYSRWYVPSNVTVIAVGDVEPGVIAGSVEKHFGAGPKVPRPADLDVGVRRQSGKRAIVATDPELTREAVSIARVEPPNPPTATVEAYRRDLMEEIGLWAFNRRISAQLAKGKASFLEASASVRQVARAIRLVTAQASGKPGQWRRMLADLAINLQRARLHGFSEHEVEEARKSLIAQAEEAAEREGTLPARALLRRINGSVARREPALSAAQRLELLKRLLPGISTAEVSRLFAANFDPTHVTFILEAPLGNDVPGDGDLIGFGRSALNVKPDREAEVAAPPSLLETLPSGGKIVESREHAASAVLSGWLDNGGRLHYRFMAERRSEATVTITFAGGEIQETAANRGITQAAAVAWSRPATSRLTSIQIRALMTGKKVRVSASAGQDTLTLRVSGSPSDLEAGLQLAYLLLTDPVIEPAAFDQWRETEAQRIASRKVRAAGALGEAVAAAFYPKDEPRPRPLEIEHLRSIRLDAAQAWLRKIVAEAPMEVAVVGDLERSAAMGLVERYLGSLPARDRIGPRTLSDLRRIERPAGPISVERKIDVKTPQAFVMDGFFGTDIRNIRDSRLLGLAARVLSTRMNRVIREEKQLVYSIGASSRPASEYPGFGTFAARAPTDPVKAGALAAVLDEMYAAFAKDGPTEDEIAVARRQIANLLDQAMREPDFWLGRLSILEYRGLRLDDVVEAPAAYRRYSAQEVREAFARYYRPESRFRFVITPGKEGGETSPAYPPQ